MLKRWLGLILIHLTTVRVMAADSGLTTNPIDTNAFARMLLGLFATLAVIFVLAWLGRKTRLVNNFNSSYQMKTLANLSLTHKEKLCLVEVGDKHILVAVAPGNVTNIHVFDEPVTMTETGGSETNNAGFATQFKKALARQLDSKSKS